jgi:hypothetical protein
VAQWEQSTVVILPSSFDKSIDLQKQYPWISYRTQFPSCDDEGLRVKIVMPEQEWTRNFIYILCSSLLVPQTCTPNFSFQYLSYYSTHSIPCLTSINTMSHFLFPCFDTLHFLYTCLQERPIVMSHKKMQLLWFLCFVLDNLYSCDFCVLFFPSTNSSENP